MPIYDEPAIPNPYLSQQDIQGTPSIGKYLSQAFAGAYKNNPVMAVVRSYDAEAAAAETGRITGIGTAVASRPVPRSTGPFEHYSIEDVFKENPDARDSWLTKEQAEERLANAGLAGAIQISEQGANMRSLDIAVNSRIDEQTRNSVYERRRAGLLVGGLGFGAEVAASLADPVGLASNFIPVVGQAKYARMLAATKSVWGRAGVRAAVGSAEGIVGAAMLEPIIAHASVSEQLDYTMADSFYNTMFGGLFGAVSHVGMGAAVDALGGMNRLPLDKRKAVAEAAVVDATLGNRPKFAQSIAIAVIDGAEAKAAKAELDVAVAELEAAKAADFNVDRIEAEIEADNLGMQLSALESQLADSGTLDYSTRGIPYGVGNTPTVLNLIDDMGGIRGIASTVASVGKRSAEYDDTPSLPGVYNRIMRNAKQGSAGSPADVMATNLHTQHGIGDGTTGTMWRMVYDDLASRKKTRQDMPELEARKLDLEQRIEELERRATQRSSDVEPQPMDQPDPITPEMLENIADDKTRVDADILKLEEELRTMGIKPEAAIEPALREIEKAEVLADARYQAALCAVGIKK
jgi:hypothetical protein